MIKFDKVVKKFGSTPALDNVDLEINDKEFVFLTGPTGAGKTTFFRLLIRDLLPTKGKIFVGDLDVAKLPSHKIPHLRKKIGVVFQDLKLLLDRTIFENIALPLEIIGKTPSEIKRRVDELLFLVGLSGLGVRFPRELSGGELQRVTIARAIAADPQILLADEPTGNLDIGTSWGIMKLLSEINERGTTVVMATHNMEIVAALKKRKIVLDKGKITKDEKRI
ncbi:ATP-binding cassette domain-containing protein [Candidatus Microgenomates bacterium]|nr:ATP-binding cassette domain-containing protein [Candidatus Microgenomates bacterium]